MSYATPLQALLGESKETFYEFGDEEKGFAVSSNGPGVVTLTGYYQIAVPGSDQGAVLGFQVDLDDDDILFLQDAIERARLSRLGGE